MGDWLTDTRKSYDTVAVDYAEYTRQALASTPILHTALRFFAESVDGPVADAGCGPGLVTAHLHSLGVNVSGFDLSPAMIELARREHPGPGFEVGSLTGCAKPDSRSKRSGCTNRMRRCPPRSCSRGTGETICR